MPKPDLWRPWALPVLVLIALVIRWPTFYHSVINHDESTYIMIGQALWNGDTYLVDAFDTKPIGIFLIYALFAAISGGSIFIIRLLTTLLVAGTAYFLFRLGTKATGHTRVGWAAGIMYVIICSLFTYYGISPNTELFFNLFTVAGIWLAWPSPKNKLFHYVLAGLLLGFAFIIKYVVAGDAFALGLFLLWVGFREGEWQKAIFQRCAPLTLAFFIPIGLTYLYYHSIGQTEAFLFYTFEVTSRYPVEAAWWRRLLFMADFLLRFFPLVVLAFFALRQKLTAGRWFPYFCLLWFVCDMVILLLPGKFFGHYQVQLMPALAAMAACWFQPGRDSVGFLRKVPARWGYTALAVFILSLSITLGIYYANKKDAPRQIARELRSRMQVGDVVYTGNYHHIVNHLLEQPSLTPYVHSSLLYYEHHLRALQLDLEAESKRLIEEKQPRFVLLRAWHENTVLTQKIKANYQLIDTLPDHVLLFEKRHK